MQFVREEETYFRTAGEFEMLLSRLLFMFAPVARLAEYLVCKQPPQ